MKKIIIAFVLGAIVAVSTAFGQGYITFGGGIRTVWNVTGSSSVYGSPVGPVTDSGFNATFLWSSSASISPMFVATIPTNNSTAYSYTTAWADIEGAGASGWNVAATEGVNPVGSPANNLGGFSYSSGSAFGLDNSTGSGQVINMYVIAWENEGGLHTTLSAAEAANAPVGWSSVFSYTLGSGPPALPPASTTVPPFGIGPTPEPATMALVGLGGVAMLFLGRSRGASGAATETLIKLDPRRMAGPRI